MTEAESTQAQLNRLKKENNALHRENLRLKSHRGKLEDVAKIVAHEPDRDELIKQVALYIATALKAEKLLLGTRHNDTIIFDTLVEQRRLKPTSRAVQLGEGVAGWVIQHKQSYLGPSLDGGEEKSESHSVLAVPIFNHQRHLLGVIECHKARHHLPFTPKEAELLQAMAQQIAPGLARALLFDQMESWTSSFENLLMFSASLNGKLESAVLIRRLVEHATSFLGAESGLAGLTGATEIVTDGYWQAGQWHPFQKRWLPQETHGTPGWVLINQCPYLTHDYPNDSLAEGTLRDSFKVKNALCVPIMDAREAVLGFVELHNKSGGREAFNWSDAHFLEALANSTAISLYNAYLLTELESQKAGLQALAARNLTLLENERQRIARELHDEAGQLLIGIKLELQLLAKKVSPIAPELQPAFDRLRHEINGSTDQIKEIARALRPPILDEMGLEAALKRQVADFQKRSEFAIQFDAVNLTTRLPQLVETTCYRIVQEALTNVTRHAQASRVSITLISDEAQTYLHIQDDGCGFDPNYEGHAGLGLLGIQERVMMLNGTFTIETSSQAGTCLNIVIPNLSELGRSQS